MFFTEVEPNRSMSHEENKFIKKDMVFINGIVSQPKIKNSMIQPKVLVQLPHKIHNQSLKLTNSAFERNNLNKFNSSYQANVSDIKQLSQLSFPLDCNSKNQAINFVGSQVVPGKTLLRGIKPKPIGKERTTFTTVSQLGQQIKVISPSKVPSSAKIFKADSINTTKSVKFIGTPKKCQQSEKKTAKFGTSLPPKITTTGYRTPSSKKYCHVNMKSAEKLKSSPYAMKNEVQVYVSKSSSRKSLALWDTDGRDSTLSVSLDSSYEISPACSSTSSCQLQTPNKFLLNPGILVLFKN